MAKIIKTQQKVIVFIARRINNKVTWLAMRNNPHPQHGGDRWYVVTGGVEANEPLQNAAVREVQEETSINDFEYIKPLNVEYKYFSDSSPKTEFVEHGYVMMAKTDRPLQLNEEHIDYKWLDIKEFTNLIWWEGSRVELSEMLTNAIS